MAVDPSCDGFQDLIIRFGICPLSAEHKPTDVELFVQLHCTVSWVAGGRQALDVRLMQSP